MPAFMMIALFQVDIPDLSVVTLQSLLDWVYGSPLPKTRLTPHLLAAADK